MFDCVYATSTTTATTNAATTITSTATTPASQETEMCKICSKLVVALFAFLSQPIHRKIIQRLGCIQCCTANMVKIAICILLGRLVNTVEKRENKSLSYSLWISEVVVKLENKASFNENLRYAIISSVPYDAELQAIYCLERFGNARSKSNKKPEANIYFEVSEEKAELLDLCLSIGVEKNFFCFRVKIKIYSLNHSSNQRDFQQIRKDLIGFSDICWSLRTFQLSFIDKNFVSIKYPGEVLTIINMDGGVLDLSANIFSFGWYRAEVIGALVSVIMIWVITAILVWLAIERCVTQDFEVNAAIMLITSGIAIVVNLIYGLVKLFWNAKSNHINSMNTYHIYDIIHELCRAA
uniref:Cation efflux protein transmembrane domain-containing protein n=1 Tax=Glossina brevipalpis TaxID=37001 RepID=A0A1A9WZH4_9MUSC